MRREIILTIPIQHESIQNYLYVVHWLNCYVRDADRLWTLNYRINYYLFTCIPKHLYSIIQNKIPGI